MTFHEPFCQSFTSEAACHAPIADAQNYALPSYLPDDVMVCIWWDGACDRRVTATMMFGGAFSVGPPDFYNGGGMGSYENSELGVEDPTLNDFFDDEGLNLDCTFFAVAHCPASHGCKPVASGTRRRLQLSEPTHVHACECI